MVRLNSMSRFRTTSFVEQMSTWYDDRTKAEVVNYKLFQLIQVRWNYWWGLPTVWSVILNERFLTPEV